MNNGAIVLVVPNERQARIEIGYGLEGDVTDSQAGNLMDTYMIPYFKNNNYEQGIVDGTTVLAIHIAKAYGYELSAIEPEIPKDTNTEDFILGLMGIIFMCSYILISCIKGFCGDESFDSDGGGSFGGGSSSFGGGGGFGGGGSSRSW